ncbi:MAG TPA: PQQ-dependent sugar dehydrogenase [Acidimicrobiia bacterium]
MSQLLALLFAVLLALAPGGTFTDDDGSIHEGDIEAIAAEGVTRGCNPPFNDRFCPKGSVDRGAFAAFLVRAMDLPAATQDWFEDDDGHLFEAEINALAEAGITRGCNPPANDSFCPDRRLNRGELAALMRRAFALPSSSTDWFTDDEGNLFEDDINAIAEVGITRGCNPPANTRYCPGQTMTREQMASFLTRAFGYTEMIPPPRPPLQWELVVGGLSSPVQALTPPGEDRILIVQQGGLVRVFENGALRSEPFLDLTGSVVTGGERGLLSLAFHPDYPSDRRVFAWYSGPLRSGGSGNHTTYLVEFDVAPDGDTAGSPRTVLAVDQPYDNHNGGFVGFGPDGYLYLGLGDGGSGNDPQGRARNLNTLLGKMIRIDVDNGEPYGIPPDNPYVGRPGRDEIWSIGLRNPWRWSIHDGYMYIGDVGQGAREEVDMVEIEPTGYDFGWSRFEGTLCNPNDTDPSCSTSGITMPIVEYGRSVGRTVTGGVVYDGPTVNSLRDFYLYADVYSGRVFAFRRLGSGIVDHTELTDRLGRTGIVNFSRDGDGEILIADLFHNAVYRLVGG